MARSPDRSLRVYFVGAGFSKALGLPNTAELLTEVHQLSEGSSHWGVSRNMPERLRRAYRYFYPAQGKNFQPPVGDFFMVLATYEAIAARGLPQGFSDHTLLSDLRFAIANILSTRTKAVDKELGSTHEFLDEAIQPNNVIITSNWDFLLERAAQRRGVPFRLRWYDDESAVTILKLHGSADWTAKEKAKKAWSTDNYYRLKDLVNSGTSRHDSIAGKPIARSHAIENWSRAYQTIKGATYDPYMITMARGKSEQLDVLMNVWSDAYNVLSRARELDVVGYSMPEDDTEIRTLLRAGVCRGSRDPRVHVKNPAPDVHVRVRDQIFDRTTSDYSAVGSL
jgi:hypothetical protein